MEQVWRFGVIVDNNNKNKNKKKKFFRGGEFRWKSME